MRKHSKSIMALTTIITLASAILVAGTAISGDLEPSATPGPTMKTLDQIPPTWSIKLPAAERFVVLADFDNEAVLDKETGLVWQRQPITTTRNWTSAMSHCMAQVVGGRKGWKLPTIQELNSLIDPSMTSPGPPLPDGHPFTNVPNDSFFWSATSRAENPDYAFAIELFRAWDYNQPKTSLYHYWCVRGGSGPDSQ